MNIIFQFGRNLSIASIPSFQPLIPTCVGVKKQQTAQKCGLLLTNYNPMNIFKFVVPTALGEKCCPYCR
ncbi:MAG: hypothetical protein IT258_18605 [Saprospiraceae bacterium]|nr:hypothetical protein [Saprospiraceae bacterium]